VRAAAQLLHRPHSAREPVEIARATAGIQAQDQVAARLSFRSRSRSLRASDVDRARSEERSLLRTWLMRMTIHLIPTEDAGWMLPLFEPGTETWSRRRLGQLGMPAAQVGKALRLIAGELARDGPLTRSELGERLEAAGVRLNPQTRLHVMLTAVTSGLACLGPDRGASTALVRREDWLGKPPRFDRDAALAELARRYLRAFGPASDRDFARWSGLGLREVRGALRSIADEIEERKVGERELLALRGRLPRLPPEGQLRLLGNFDTYLLGYQDRGFAVSAAHAGDLKAGGGGWIRPVIVRDGVVIGGWRTVRKRGLIELSLKLSPGERVANRAAVEAELEDISRFEGIAVRRRRG
jgi:hypothetical protein